MFVLLLLFRLGLCTYVSPQNKKGSASSQCPSSTHAHEMSSTQRHQQSTQPTTRPPAKPINDAIHYTINSAIIIYDTIIDVVHMERMPIGRSLPDDNPSHCRSVLTPTPPHPTPLLLYCFLEIRPVQTPYQFSFPL